MSLENQQLQPDQVHTDIQRALNPDAAELVHRQALREVAEQNLGRVMNNAGAFDALTTVTEDTGRTDVKVGDVVGIIKPVQGAAEQPADAGKMFRLSTAPTPDGGRPQAEVKPGVDFAKEPLDPAVEGLLKSGRPARSWYNVISRYRRR